MRTVGVIEKIIKKVALGAAKQACMKLGGNPPCRKLRLDPAERIVVLHKTKYAERRMLCALHAVYAMVAYGFELGAPHSRNILLE